MQHGLISMPFAGSRDKHVNRDGECGFGRRETSAHTQGQVIEVNGQFHTAGLEIAVEQHLLSGSVEDGHSPIGRLLVQPPRQPLPRSLRLLTHDGGAGCGRFLAPCTHADVQRGVGFGRAYEPGVVAHRRHRFRTEHLTIEEPLDLQNAARKVTSQSAHRHPRQHGLFLPTTRHLFRRQKLHCPFGSQ